MGNGENEETILTQRSSPRKRHYALSRSRKVAKGEGKLKGLGLKRGHREHREAQSCTELHRGGAEENSHAKLPVSKDKGGGEESIVWEIIT